MATFDKVTGNPEKNSAPERGSTLYLTGVCTVAAMGGVLFGFDTAVISGARKLLVTQFSLDPWMEGWVVSSVLLGCICGAMAAGTLSDRFGRKKMLLLSAGLFLISALGSAIPQTPAVLIVVRLVGGLGVGVASMLAPLYISELSPPHLRGRMVALYQFAITLGVLAAYLSNAYVLHVAKNFSAWFGQATLRWIFVDEFWRGMFLAEALPAVLFLLLLLLVPESPRWLTKQHRGNEAMAILARVVGRETAALEMDEIQDTIAHESGSVWQLFQPGMRIALLIGVMLPIFAQLSGINVIIYYGEQIFNEANWQLSDALGGLVVIGAVNAAFTLLTLWKIDSIGRKPIMQIGTFGAVVSLATIGTLFYFKVQAGPWLLGAILCYIASFAISFGPIPWVIISEIFPTRIRGRAMSFGVFAIWATCLLVALTFPWMNENLGPATCFWLYASLCAPSLLFVWLVVPETKGRTLEEIEKSWTR